MDDTANITREAWLRERSTFLGASEIYEVAFGDIFSVYLRKVGITRGEADNQRMKMGRLLEPLVMELYSEETGKQLYRPGYRVWRHPEHDFIGCTPDALVIDEPVLVEGKTADKDEARHWGMPGSDYVPERYFCQAQWQMLACAELGITRVDIPVLIGGNDFRVYSVFPSEVIQAHLLEVGQAFWKRVQTQTPPPFDWKHPRAVELLNLLVKPEPDTSKEMDWIHQADADLYLSLVEEIKTLEKQKEEIKARLMMDLGECETGILPDGGKVSRKLVRRKGYTVEDGEYVRFDVSPHSPVSRKKKGRSG